MSRELATIVFTVYNQERYVRESLTSALMQNYEPLEIIVSDDGSSDGTKAIIDDVVSENGFVKIAGYDANPGIQIFRKGEKAVVVNFNTKNLGICENFEYAFGLAHGELVFTFVGDDISIPARVGKIMAAWVADGKRAKVLTSGGWLMDVDGKVYREYRREVLNGAPVGAFNAYARCVYDDFPRIKPELAAQTYEDSIYGLRAQFFSPPLYVDELLVRYRYGSGVSTGGGYRRKMIRGAKAVKASCEQLLLDLDSLTNKVDAGIAKAFRQRFEARIKHEQSYLQLLDGHNLRERIAGYVASGYLRRSWKTKLLGLVLLLPHRLGDWLLAL